MDDPNVAILLSIASGSIILLFIFAYFKQKQAEKEPERAVPRRGNEGVRRVGGGRNARARMQARIQALAGDDTDEEDEADEPAAEMEPIDGKIGAKKRAKLEAKAERKTLREAEERLREDRKKRQEQEEEERKKDLDRLEAERKKQEDEERRQREEKERQDYEEYLKIKAMFSVEEEGYEEGGGEEEEGNLLQAFINYIKMTKVVVLEDLAAHFKMKTQSVIDRIQELQEQGQLTGVVDDRGKFIYVSQEELEAVAKFVKQRGRVSITELAESSNQLINLNSSVNQAVPTES
uniref:DDRGK domain-containing protein 1 n=1 Tax=Timema poppense TaxID=170557 RepID=A0A7R9CT19_TIMPO|nr:unnamed protein product [Timema poppensis]